MTSASYNQLVAYLKSLAAKNKGENTQTNQQAAGVASGSNNNLSSALIKHGPKAAKWAYNAYTQPASAMAASEAGVEGAGVAGGYGSTGAGTGVTMAEAGGAQGGSSLGSMGASGMTWGGAASLIAPLVMAYLQYQKGSGVNEPLRKQYETVGLGRLLSDKMAGKEIDAESQYKDYAGVKPKYLSDWLDPNRGQEGFDQPGANRTLDPRGWSPWELYEGMHRYGTGHRQTNNIGNSGYSDQQIDEMFGNQKGDLSKMLGGDVPDWSKTTWDQANFFNPEETKRQKDLADRLSTMTDNDRGDLLNRNRQWLSEGSPGPTDDKFYMESLEREREREELEKLLGYKLGG